MTGHRNRFDMAVVDEVVHSPSGNDTLQDYEIYGLTWLLTGGGTKTVLAPSAVGQRLLIVLDSGVAPTVSFPLAVDGVRTSISLVTPGDFIEVVSAEVAGVLRWLLIKDGVAVSSKIFNVDLSGARVWDDRSSLLPSTAAADDLAIITGTFGTDLATLQSGDLKAAGSTTRFAAFQFALPQNYVSGENLVIRVRGGMLTTSADTAATVDLGVHRSDGSGAVGADIVATASQTINSLTKADRNFTVTGTTLLAGDIIDVRLAVNVNDAATGTAVIAEVSDVRLIFSAKS